MSWEDILKAGSHNSDFIIFLMTVFNISREDALNIKASLGIKQAISRGGFLNHITEEDFNILSTFADAKRYEKLVKFLEELYSKGSRVLDNEWQKEYRKRPEVIERRKEQRQMPDNKEKKRKYDQERERRLR